MSPGSLRCRQSFLFFQIQGTPLSGHLLRILLTGSWLVSSATAQVTVPLDDPTDHPSPAPSFSAPKAPPTTPPEAPPEIRDIRGPIDIRSPWRPWLIGAGIALAVAACISLIALLVRRLGRTPEVAPPSPYELAMEELHATQPLMKAGKDKAFSIAVSDSVRYFLERQFAMPAPENTTEEFLSSIHQHKLIKGHLASDFSSFLSLCDLAKFARRRHGLEGMEKLYRLGEKLIEGTYLKHHMQERVLAKGAKPVARDDLAGESA